MEESRTFYVNESDLVCSVCLESWIEKDNRILDCQHTFCLQCLTGMNRENPNIIHCPNCRHETQITNGNVENLRKNLFRQILQEEKKESNNEIIDKKKFKKRTTNVKLENNF